MKALKGIMTYTAIVLLSLVVIGALVIGLMFFTKINVFGWFFLQTNKRSHFIEAIEFTNLLKSDDVQLNINTNSYGITVIPVDSTKLSISTDNIYIGFLKGTETDKGYEADTMPTITKKVLSDEKGKLIIDVTLNEPEGLLSISETSSLILRVPHTFNNNIVKYNISAKTQNGNIKLSNSVDDKGEFFKALVVTGLEMKTNRGDVIIQGFGDRETGAKTTNLELDNLDITTNGGTFDFTHFQEIKVKEKVVLKNSKATYLFNNLVCCNRWVKTFELIKVVDQGETKDAVNTVYTTSGVGGLEISGEVVKFVANNVYCGSDGFIYKSNTGVLRINNVFTGAIEESIYSFTEKNDKGVSVFTGETQRRINSAIPYENTIFTDSAVVELGNVVGKLGLYNEYGNVVINLMSNQATMRTENGDIIVRSSGYLYNEQSDVKEKTEKSSMILYSTFGNIYAMEYYQDAVIYSKKGKIEAHSKYYENPDKTHRYYYSDISTKDGKVIATTEKNPIKIIASDSANIKLTITDILDTSNNPFAGNLSTSDMYQAISKNGTVNVTVPLKSYKVKVKYKRLEGSIGATSTFGDDYVQINKENEYQPKMTIQGNYVILACSV